MCTPELIMLIRQKKVVLFPGIDRVKIFYLLTARMYQNMYQNINFLFKKNTRTDRDKNQKKLKKIEKRKETKEEKEK